MLYRHLPGNKSFDAVARTPYVEIRHHAQGGRLLNRLVRRAVFAHADGVMRKHINRVDLHQRCHTNGVTGIFREHQKGAAVRTETTVQDQTVHDRRHAKFTHTVVEVIAALGHRLRAHAAAALPHGQIGRCQVGRTANKLRHHRSQRLNGVL